MNLIKGKYSLKPLNIIEYHKKQISSFLSADSEENLDLETVESFGSEWQKFDSFSLEQIEKAGDEYFDVVPKEILNEDTYVLDVGCGTGRWTKYIAPKVGFVEAIDPSEAVFSAVQLLEEEQNIRVTHAQVSNIPFADETFDLVFSLGVLHHIPDTYQGVVDCVKKVKKGGHFLVYLYYNLDGRNPIYKLIYKTSNLFRLVISKLSPTPKKIICDILAILIYFPLVSLGTIVKNFFPNKSWYKKIPLAYYVGKSINIIRNDSLDRFGTPLEQRFSRQEIQGMLEKAGLTNIKFSNSQPYWHVIGTKPE